jgi:hypothetical protein
MLKYISAAINCLNEHKITNKKKTLQQALDSYVKKIPVYRKMLKECKSSYVNV